MKNLKQQLEYTLGTPVSTKLLKVLKPEQVKYINLLQEEYMLGRIKKVELIDSYKSILDIAKELLIKDKKFNYKNG